MKINQNSVPVKNPAVFSMKPTSDEIVLINADSAVSIALTNHTAVCIWELIDGKTKIKEIIHKINIIYKNVPESVETDVLNLIDQLSKKGFIGFEMK